MRKTKPKPKLKKPVRKVTRNPYARALEQAKKKHEKALDDLEKAEAKVAKLKLELPRLAQVCDSLEAYINGDAMPTRRTATVQRLAAKAPTDNTDSVSPLPELGERKPSGPLPTNAMDAVPAHLRHMIKEHPAIDRGSIGQAHGMVVNVDVDPANEDGFLPEPEGIELLPD